MKKILITVIALGCIFLSVDAAAVQFHEVMHALRQVEISTGERTIHSSSMSVPAHRSEAAQWAHKQRAKDAWVENNSAPRTETVCVRRAENGAIERITGGVFGTTEGAIGAAVGGLVGHKVSDGKDAAVILGVIVGNKIGNNMEHNKNCYVVEVSE